MQTIGFPMSHKENEYRRALLPIHIKLMQHPEMLYFEEGYGDVIGIPETEYSALGCHVVSREVVLQQDVICDPKVGDAEYLESLRKGQILFGWIHATQNLNIADKIVRNRLTGYAWEYMNNRGRHVFWRNNELAGEAAVIHAFQCYGKMPYETKVAVLGRGNTARGAIKILNMFGAQVMQYDRHSEHLLREEIADYDVVVNCIAWDLKRIDHIIYKTDLLRMKPNAMIIDVSCDKNGGVETSTPTTIEHPIYVVNNIVHYVVDHTPSLFYKTFTYDNSAIIYPYLEELIQNDCGDVLKNALIAKDGLLINKR